MSLNWRLALSLERLRQDIAKRAPMRNKASDGAIGDAKHATRDSDHNPWVKHGNESIVTAIDITHDPAPIGGCDAKALAEALRKSKDARIKYVIFFGRMFSSYVSNGKPAWEWRPYSGANKHEHHMHISVQPEKKLYDSAAPWAIG